MKILLKSLALLKNEYLESNQELDPEVFSSQVGCGFGSGYASETQRNGIWIQCCGSETILDPYPKFRGKWDAGPKKIVSDPQHWFRPAEELLFQSRVEID
jgi:hypothetical protein